MKENATVSGYRPKVFTWHIHGTYLYYLSLAPVDIYIPVNSAEEEGYCGRGETFPFGNNVIEVDAEEVRNMDFDCILFQTDKNYVRDQYEILSPEQQSLPRIYLEHDPPWKSPADEIHIVQDPEVALVHVTHYNRLMWHNLVPIVEVIEHGIPVSHQAYEGQLEKGLVISNNIQQRGRKLGADIFEALRQELPLDLIGMNTAGAGGLGEILHPRLPGFVSKYRFVFNPIRYTSLGLAFLEAMSFGVPVVTLATREYGSVITNGQSGFISNDIDELKAGMQRLLSDHAAARQMGSEARELVRERFSIKRFSDKWLSLIRCMISRKK